MQNMIIWSRCAYIGTCLLVLHPQAPGRGCGEWLETPYSTPQLFKKTKKTMLQALKNFFKTKKGNTYADIKDYFDDLYRLGVDTFCMA